MATLVFGMNVSLDGYVDHDRFAPSPGLFAHFIEQAREQAGSLYGRKLYEIMAYWDEDRPEWNAPERAFAEAWRAQPKWVASRGAPPLGPNATLLGADLEAEIRTLKATVEGESNSAAPTSPPASRPSASSTSTASTCIPLCWATATLSSTPPCPACSSSPPTPCRAT
jgi:hypothetical protein